MQSWIFSIITQSRFIYNQIIKSMPLLIKCRIYVTLDHKSHKGQLFEIESDIIRKLNK